jgi:hypothetical protein
MFLKLLCIFKTNPSKSTLHNLNNTAGRFLIITIVIRPPLFTICISNFATDLRETNYSKAPAELQGLVENIFEMSYP